MTSKGDPNQLQDTALFGYCVGCELARQQGAFALNWSLLEAARGKLCDQCQLAVSLGASDFNEMLRVAARGGHRNICQRAKDWGATDFNWMLLAAAQGGHRDLCELAVSWGATNFDEMLYAAARIGHRDLCELAVSWGATDFNLMLIAAAQGGHRDICELAVSWAKSHGVVWGAIVFDKMLKCASTEELKSLARYWQACVKDPTLPAWVSLFGLLLVTDGYFRLRCPPSEGNYASPAHVRWLKIVSQLPLELQAVVCFRVHGLTQDPVVTGRAIDAGGCWLFEKSS